MYFIRKTHAFSLLHAHFNVYHYLMILCHFDQMNDKMMFSLSIESLSYHYLTYFDPIFNLSHFSL